MPKTSLICLLGVFCLAVPVLATDVQLSKDGIGPIRMDVNVQLDGKKATLVAPAVNSSGKDIQFAKFCVAPPATKKCNFELWTTAVWKVGQELKWTLSGRAMTGIDHPVVTVIELEPVETVLKQMYAVDEVQAFTSKEAVSSPGKLSKNEQVDVLEETSPWSKVRTKRFTGYVASAFLSDSKIEKPHQEKPASAGPSALQSVLQGLATGMAAAAPPPQHKIMIFGGLDHKTYLGCLNCSEYATDSVTNPYGKGSPYSSESIWNHYSEFGSAYSTYGACNQYATDPPVIVDEAGNFYGRLTLNRYHPQLAAGANYIGWLTDKVCK